MKPPLEFHSGAFQQWLRHEGSRDNIIGWLRWNDPNGCYSDHDSLVEGYLSLTLQRARQVMHEQITRP